MAFLFNVPQWCDNNNVPLVSPAYIQVYDTGTTTLSAIYTDSSGTTQLSNPYLLQPGGRVGTNGLWLGTTKNYDIYAYDKNGVLVQQFLNTTGVGTTIAFISILNANLNTNGYNLITTNNNNIGIIPNGSGNFSVTTTSGNLTLNSGTGSFSEITGGSGTISLTSNSGLISLTSTSGNINLNPGSGKVQIANSGFNLNLSTTLTGTRTYTLPDQTGTVFLAGGGTALGISDGGTGQIAKQAAFDALSPTTTQGDLIYRNATNNVRLGASAQAYQVLTTQGAAANPNWQTAPIILSSGTASSGQNVTLFTGLAIPTGVKFLRLCVFGTVSMSSSTGTASLQWDPAGGTSWVTSYNSLYTGGHGTTVYNSLNVASNSLGGVPIHLLFGTNTGNYLTCVDFSYNNAATVVHTYTNSGSTYNNTANDSYEVSGSIANQSVGNSSLSVRIAGSSASATVTVGQYSLMAVF